MLDLLRSEKVLFVHGRGFNWPHPDHFRVVYLPPVEDIGLVMGKMKQFLKGYRQHG